MDDWLWPPRRPVTTHPGTLRARAICLIRGHRPVKAYGVQSAWPASHWQPIWLCATCGRETPKAAAR